MYISLIIKHSYQARTWNMQLNTKYVLLICEQIFCNKNQMFIKKYPSHAIFKKQVLLQEFTYFFS